MLQAIVGDMSIIIRLILRMRLGSLVLFLFLLEGFNADDFLHLIEVLINVMYLSVQKLRQFLDLSLAIDAFLALETLLAL